MVPLAGFWDTVLVFSAGITGLVSSFTGDSSSPSGVEAMAPCRPLSVLQDAALE